MSAPTLCPDTGCDHLDCRTVRYIARYRYATGVEYPHGFAVARAILADADAASLEELEAAAAIRDGAT